MVLRNFLQLLPEVQSDFAIIILNQPILCDPLLIKSLWNKAVLRVLVDGGSNQWINFVREYKLHGLKLPDFISGDFDSMKPETRKHFEELKVNFIHTPDQDSTDFTKALSCLRDHSKSRNLNINVVLVVCENSGRFDQAISNINTLHMSNNILPSIPVVMISSHCVTWVLQPGNQTIHVREEFVREQYSCGLIPFCGPTLVTTSGLKWNLDNHVMEIGGLVSTSNTYTAEEINVTCNRRLLWTTQYCRIHQ